MTQPPPPGFGPEGSDQPTRSFGAPGAEQPTQSFPAQGAPHPAGYPPYGAGPGGQVPQGGGDPGQPGGRHHDQHRRSPALIVGVIVAVLVLAGLVFTGVWVFGNDESADPGPGVDETDPAVAETDPPEGDDDAPPAADDPDSEDPAEADDQAETFQDPGDGSGPEPGGELYDYLTGSVEAVDGQVTSWTIDPPGWQQFEDLDITPAEAYNATFTSAEGESISMWAARLDDVDAAVAFAEDLVADRGESDQSGEVWQIDDAEEVDDDLAYGEHHLWQDGEDIEVIWWDDTGVVRYLSGPAEEAWDFYLWSGI